MSRTITWPGNKARWVALLVSSVLSSTIGWGLYRIVRASPSHPPINTDYTLTFVDAHHRPLTEKPGQLQLQLDPLLLYRNRPRQNTRSFTIDEHGFRGGIQTSLPKVFVLGASAVFGQDLDSDQQTLSAQLGKLDPTYEFINAGVVGYLSGQELAIMVHQADRFRPVGYILMSGWNEIFDQYHFSRRPADRLGYNNAFFDLENRLASLASANLGSTPTPSSPPTLPSPADSLRQIIDQYLLNVDRMADFARARGAFFLWVIQPELSMKKKRTVDEDRALDTFNHAYGYVDRGFPEAYQELVHQSIRHAEQKEIPYIDPMADRRLGDASETLFRDPVHLSSEGNEILAQVLHQALPQIDHGEKGTETKK